MSLVSNEFDFKYCSIRVNFVVVNFFFCCHGIFHYMRLLGLLSLDRWLGIDRA